MSSEYGNELQETEIIIQDMREAIKTLTKAVIELNNGRISSETAAMLRTILRENKEGI
jgi:hypothetical protein